MLTPNRYEQFPDIGSSRHSDSDTQDDFNFGPNKNPLFGPFGNGDCITFSQMNIVNEMRYLWLQLVIWSRSYINNKRSRQGAVPAVYERLYSVPAGFYYYMNLFFGKVIAEEFIYLLSQNIIIFADLISAMLEGNQQNANSGQSAWYGNANEISTFLVQINNTWNYNQWLDLLNRYITMHLDEATAILSNNYRREIVIYDRLQYHSLIIADYMSKGVMNSLFGNRNDVSLV